MATIAERGVRITAGGDREHLRWQHPDGRYLVLTLKGRLLRQDDAGVYVSIARGRPWTVTLAEAVADRDGFAPVASRGVK